MKSVLISIKPEWCELIAEGKKTMEVRKSAPKLDTPFKVYIYCTKGDSQFSEGDRFCLYAPPYDTPVNANQKVIGEFICDIVEPYWFDKDDRSVEEYEDVQHSCVAAEELLAYASGKQLYFWHISQLKMYDRPKSLGAFLPYKRPPQSWCYVEEKE